jgi:hypothetical protein
VYATRQHAIVRVRAQEQLLRTSTPFSAVTRFVVAVLRRWVPTSLLGDAHNRRVFERRECVLI